LSNTVTSDTNESQSRSLHSSLSFLVADLTSLDVVAIGKLEPNMRKASHRSRKQQSRSCTVITLLLLVRATYIWVLFFAHIPFVDLQCIQWDNILIALGCAW